MILGIDAALSAVGVAHVIDGKVLSATVQNFRNRDADRHELALAFIRATLDPLSPGDIVALEDGYVGPNMMTSLALGQLRGAIGEAVVSRGLVLIRVMPRQWMADAGAIDRRGRQLPRAQGKALALRYARLRSGIRTLTQDAADAVCVALWAYNRLSRGSRIEKGAAACSQR